MDYRVVWVEGPLHDARIRALGVDVDGVPLGLPATLASSRDREFAAAWTGRAYAVAWQCGSEFTRAVCLTVTGGGSGAPEPTRWNRGSDLVWGLRAAWSGRVLGLGWTSGPSPPLDCASASCAATPHRAFLVRTDGAGEPLGEPEPLSDAERSELMAIDWTGEAFVALWAEYGPAVPPGAGASGEDGEPPSRLCMARVGEDGRRAGEATCSDPAVRSNASTKPVWADGGFLLAANRAEHPRPLCRASVSRFDGRELRAVIGYRSGAYGACVTPSFAVAPNGAVAAWFGQNAVPEEEAEDEATAGAAVLVQPFDEAYGGLSEAPFALAQWSPASDDWEVGDAVVVWNGMEYGVFWLDKREGAWTLRFTPLGWPE
jgi:hypothetical protein